MNRSRTPRRRFLLGLVGVPLLAGCIEKVNDGELTASPDILSDRSHVYTAIGIDGNALELVIDPNAQVNVQTCPTDAQATCEPGWTETRVRSVRLIYPSGVEQAPSTVDKGRVVFGLDPDEAEPGTYRVVAETLLGAVTLELTLAGDGSPFNQGGLAIEDATVNERVEGGEEK